MSLGGPPWGAPPRGPEGAPPPILKTISLRRSKPRLKRSGGFGAGTYNEGEDWKGPANPYFNYKPKTDGEDRERHLFEKFLF